MNPSIWDATLGSFADDVAGTNPAPAAVSASAVTADLGIGLVLKVLKIAGGRKNFAGDAEKLGTYIEAAKAQSSVLRAVAEEDILAVRRFMASRDAGALNQAIEVPMQAARAAARGLELCAESAGLIQGLVAADLGAGALLLLAALRAILMSVDFNLRRLPPEDPQNLVIRAECRALHQRALQHIASVESRL